MCQQSPLKPKHAVSGFQCSSSRNRRSKKSDCQLAPREWPDALLATHTTSFIEFGKVIDPGVLHCIIVINCMPQNCILAPKWDLAIM